MNSFGVEDSQLVMEATTDFAAAPRVAHPVSIRNRFERSLTAIEVLADWLTVVIAVSSGYTVYRFLQLGRRVQYPFNTMALVSIGMGVLFVILLDRDGAYRPGNSLLRIKETERSLRVSLQAFLLVLPVTFFSRLMVSRWVFLIAMLCVPILQAIEKQLLFKGVRALRARGLGVQ